MPSSDDNDVIAVSAAKAARGCYGSSKCDDYDGCNNPGHDDGCCRWNHNHNHYIHDVDNNCSYEHDAIPPFLTIPRQRAKPVFFSPRRTSLSLRKCGIQGYILLNNAWHNNQILVQVRGTTTINWCWGIIQIQKAGGLKSCWTRCRGRCFKLGKGYKWKEGRGFRMVVRAETLGTLSRETIYLANKIKRIRIAIH